MSYAQNRIDRVRASLTEQDLDAFLIRNLSNIKWATAFDGVFDSEEAHALLVTQDQVVLHTDSRYARAATKASLNSSILIDDKQESHAEFVCRILEGHNKTKLSLGIESSMALGEFRGLETAYITHEIPLSLVETQNFLVPLRGIKDKREIERLRLAQSITDKAFSHIINCIKPGMTERAVQIELEDYLIRNGASSLAFSSIVATGENGANPHAIPGDRLIEKGQAIVLDFGAKAQDYCSDMTRMIFVGQPEEALMRAYAALRKANEAVEAFLRPGVTGAEAQLCAESILADCGFAHTMGHSLGHGVGIDIHEEPVLSMRNTTPLEAGNVVTVEPGIYMTHLFGMRLEDFGVVTQTGFEVFTQSTHDMVII